MSSTAWSPAASQKPGTGHGLRPARPRAGHETEEQLPLLTDFAADVVALLDALNVADVVLLEVLDGGYMCQGGVPSTPSASGDSC